MPDRIQKLAPRNPDLLSLAHLLRQEALVNDFQRITDHIVGFLECPETRQDLVVHSFRKEYFVEWIKLLNEQ